MKTAITGTSAAIVSASSQVINGASCVKFALRRTNQVCRPLAANRRKHRKETSYMETSNSQQVADRSAPSCSAIDRKKFKCVKIDKATTPSEGIFRVICDAWWQVTPDNEVMFYRGHSPQCNQQKTISESIRDRIHKTCSVRQIAVVFVPIDPRDYC